MGGCAGKPGAAGGKSGQVLARATTADELAERVMAASGAAAWGNVRSIRFDFVVERGGKEALRAGHMWDVKRGIDTVSWGGKSVMVDLAAAPVDSDAKAAYARWTNDTYWLLAPLKLKDGGTKLELLEPVPYAGRTLERLRVSFEGVGLTPGDVYTWYIDPESYLPVAWDYQPNATRTVRFSWDAYVKMGGLTLFTQHFAGPTAIRIENLQVTSD